MAEPGGGGGGGGGEGPGLPAFFQGGPGGSKLRVYFQNNTSAWIYVKLNRSTIEIETQERA